MEWLTFWLFAAGFAAQLVDGALGMAFGLIGASVMLGLGLPPAIASAVVHVGEVFTTAASGLAHWRSRNVDWALVRRLAVPGMAGGLIGSLILAIADAATIRPFIVAYLAIMGGLIVWRSLRPPASAARGWPHAGPIGFAGGALDAIGGGGWGAIVNGTLLANGHEPRRVIGSVNLTEFFVTLVTSATLLASLGELPLGLIAPFVVGGLFAAPLGGMIVKRLPPRLLLRAVGTLILFMNAIPLALLLGAGAALLAWR